MAELGEYVLHQESTKAVCWDGTEEDAYLVMAFLESMRCGSVLLIKRLCGTEGLESWIEFLKNGEKKMLFAGQWAVRSGVNVNVIPDDEFRARYTKKEDA